MNRRRIFTVLLAVGALALLRGAGEDGGCGEGLDNRPGEPGVDVGGVEGAKWVVDYNDKVQVTIKNAAGGIVTETFAWGTGGVFDVDGVQVDLTQMCAREDVACPNEVFPHEVTMTQPGDQRHLLYVTFNAEGPLGDLQEATLLGNVDSDDDFSIALGIKAAALGTCGLLGVSYATGHIATEPGSDPPLGQSLEGQIVTAYSGGCAVLGQSGAAGVGGTIELRVDFEAHRL